MAARYELLPTIIHFAKRICAANRLALLLGLIFFSTAQAVTTSGNASNGASLWVTRGCNGCHNTPQKNKQLNAANASNVIDYQIANGMPVNPTATERNDIAAYIATQISDPNPANLAIPYNSAGTVFVIPDISLNTGYDNTKDTFTSIVTVSGPTRGTVTFNKLNATYKPTTGQTGADEFTYNATGPAGTSNIRKVTLLIADPPPVVTNPGAMTATSGTSFNYQISATNFPTSYSLTLPLGLTLSVNSSGLVTGTLPTVSSPTNYSVTLRATNSSGTGSQTFTLTVNPPAPVVTNPGAMSVTSGAAFSYQIVATNSPTSYSVTAAGLSLSVNGSGLVTGTLPTVSSPTNYSVTLNASNATGTGSQTFTLTVNPSTPVVTNPGPTTLASGAAFSYQIVATNSPTSYSVTAAGLSLSVNGSGLVTGTLPTVSSPTNYSVTLNASNATGTGSQTFTLTVNPPAPVVTNPGSMAAASGAAFSYQVIATNSPTSYSVTASGLTLSVSSSGLVTGTLPTVTSPTNYSVTLNATNAGGTGSQTFTLTVNPPAPVVTNPGSMTATSGAAFSYQIVATNTPTSYSVTAPGLSLSVNGSGLVSGTLPSVGTPTSYSVTLDANNATGTGSQTFTLTVNPPAPVVTNPGSMAAASGAAFSYQIIATNSPTSYSVTAAGLSLSVNGSGLVTGTLPTVSSPTNYSVTLNATNVTGTGSQTFTLTVNPPAPVVTNPGAMSATSGAAFSY